MTTTYSLILLAFFNHMFRIAAGLIILFKLTVRSSTVVENTDCISIFHAQRLRWWVVISYHFGLG